MKIQFLNSILSFLFLKVHPKPFYDELQNSKSLVAMFVLPLLNTKFIVTNSQQYTNWTDINLVSF
jgi:hypothetical protein